MLNNKKIISSILALCISTLACNLPSGSPATETPTGDGSPSPTVTYTALESATPSFTPAPNATACKPSVSSNTNANVRSGPGTVYYVVGALPQNGTATVAGKSADGTWWYIEFPGGDNGHAWIAGSVTTASCIPDTLAVIAAPPTPIPPTATLTFTPSVTPQPSATPTVTNTPLVLIPIPPVIILIIGDLTVQNISLSPGGEVIATIGASGTLSGNFKYSVYVDGSLQATKTETIPAGSQAFSSGVVLIPNIFSQFNSVKVVVDPANAISETDEGNNQLVRNCNNISRTC